MENIATWIAPLATSIAALMTASNLGSRMTGYGFIVFTIGSLAWLAVGYASGQPTLVWQNVILTALNMFGIWRWLGRQARFDKGGQVANRSSAETPGEELFPAGLIGSVKITAADGTELATTVDAMIGSISGRIAYVVASEGGVGGVGETLRRMDWKDLSFRNDRIATSHDRASFNRQPTLEKDHWPGR